MSFQNGYIYVYICIYFIYLYFHKQWIHGPFAPHSRPYLFFMSSWWVINCSLNLCFSDCQWDSLFLYIEEPFELPLLWSLYSLLFPFLLISKSSLYTSYFWLCMLQVSSPSLWPLFSSVFSHFYGVMYLVLYLTNLWFNKMIMYNHALILFKCFVSLYLSIFRVINFNPSNC